MGLFTWFRGAHPPAVEVLSEAINQAVVRMPGRRYPGIVVQGDQLVALCSAARAVDNRVRELGDAEAQRLAGNLLFELEQLSEAYWAACRAEPGAAPDPAAR